MEIFPIFILATLNLSDIYIYKHMDVFITLLT